MTLGEAREHIGDAVVYLPCGGPVEEGVITSVNEHYVFVRYGADKTSKATRQADLILMATPVTDGETEEDAVTKQARKRAAELLEMAEDPNWLGI